MIDNEKKTELKPGKYRHFKGKEYEVIGIAQHSETLDKFVVYKPLYETKGNFHPLWVRPLSMFIEIIERDGKSFPRFEYIGSSEE